MSEELIRYISYVVDVMAMVIVVVIIAYRIMKS